MIGTLLRSAQCKANLPAIGVMLYALTVYQARAKAIRERSGAPYDDRLGPVSRRHSWSRRA